MILITAPISASLNKDYLNYPNDFFQELLRKALPHFPNEANKNRIWFCNMDRMNSATSRGQQSTDRHRLSLLSWTPKGNEVLPAFPILELPNSFSWAQKSQDQKCQSKMAFSGQMRAMGGSPCMPEFVWSWLALKTAMVHLTKSQSPVWLNYQENFQLTSRLWLGRNKQEIISYGAHTASMCWEVI